MNTTKIYRFKFNDNISQMLNEFSKLHMHEDKNDYNQNWELWLINNSDSIKREEARLLECGYKGNINDKLYKSAKYYYSKKKSNNEELNITKRREYVSVSSEFLEGVDLHINTFVKNMMSPANAYDDFCSKNKILLSTEIISLQQDYNFENDYIFSKLKKTYKNRYFYLLK